MLEEEKIALQRSRTVGEWITMESGIEEEICNHFISIFQTEGADTDDDVVLDAILRQITEEINSELEREVTELKIGTATFQLGGAREPDPDGFPDLFYQGVGRP